MLTNIRTNRMGTVSFDGKFPGMRKAQDFIVYPLKAGDFATQATIQSDSRIGKITLASGAVFISRPRAGGAYFCHLANIQHVATLNSEDLLMLKAAIMGTAHGQAGTNGVVYTDNSAALEVFGGAS